MKAWDREPVTNMEDIRRQISKLENPDFEADRTVDLGPCGMGMPVLMANKALKEMDAGKVLKLVSGHP